MSFEYAVFFRMCSIISCKVFGVLNYTRYNHLIFRIHSHRPSSYFTITLDVTSSTFSLSPLLLSETRCCTLQSMSYLLSTYRVLLISFLISPLLNIVFSVLIDSPNSLCPKIFLPLALLINFRLFLFFSLSPLLDPSMKFTSHPINDLHDP